MLKKRMIAGLMMLVAVQAAVAIEPGHTRSLRSCEDAVHLTRYTDTWLGRIRPTNNEKLFRDFVDYSPTCRWVITEPNGSNPIGRHNRIYQVGVDGVSQHEQFIHKGGQPNWLKPNFAILRDKCWSFMGQEKVTYLRWEKDPSKMCALIKNEDGYHMGGARNE